jgi:hypothetical protein
MDPGGADVLYTRGNKRMGMMQIISNGQPPSETYPDLLLSLFGGGESP